MQQLSRVWRLGVQDGDVLGGCFCHLLLSERATGGGRGPRMDNQGSQLARGGTPSPVASVSPRALAGGKGLTGGDQADNAIASGHTGTHASWKTFSLRTHLPPSYISGDMSWRDTLAQDRRGCVPKVTPGPSSIADGRAFAEVTVLGGPRRTEAGDEAEYHSS